MLKFGAEKGRIAMLLVTGVAGGLVFALVKLLDVRGVDLVGLLEDNSGAVAAALAIGILGALTLSVRMSIGIMEKKAF